MTPCQGLVGRLLGHRFGPRYSTLRRSYDWVVKLGGATLFREALPPDEEKRVYHGDVCPGCGQTVNAPPAAPFRPAAAAPKA